MKKLKIIAATIMALSLVLLSLSCSKDDSTTTATTKTVTVQKGDLSVSITGTGNLAYSKTEDMAFEMAGYIEEVLVSAGDTVEEGEEIARLNTDDRDEKITSLGKTLTSAQRSLSNVQNSVTKAQRALTTATEAVTKAQRAVQDREFAVQQAELDLESVQYSLSQMEDVETAQTHVDSLTASVDVAKALRAAGDETVTMEYINNLITQLEQAQAKLDKVIKGADTGISTGVNIQIAQYQLKMEQNTRAIETAKIAVEDAKNAVNDALLDETDAKTAVENAQLDVADAETAVEEAQKNLDETKSLSPIVTAPFDGFITKVNVKGGDEVFKGTVAAVIADPDKFEADILITENDIFSVKLEGEATVSLDALENVTYPAKVTKISPTASVSSGVVNYSVTVELTSLELVSTQTAMPQAPSGAASSGAMPTGTPPAGFTPPAMASTGTTETAATESYDLKDGLSATVEIIAEQVSDVLYVPTRAITTQGPRSVVQVKSGEKSETRVVTPGLEDGNYTEIKSGLSEGEQVIYTVSSSSSSSSSTKNTQQGGMAIGIGGGGPPPGGF